MRKKGIVNGLTLYFMNGLAVLLPAVVTFFFLRYIYNKMNEWGIYWLHIPEAWQFPGLGLILLVGLIIIVGMTTRWWIAKTILGKIEGFIERIPLIKELYTTLRDTFYAILGEKKSFDTVVLVSTGLCKRMGFLTVKRPVFQTSDGKEYVGVYFPQSMQISGELYWVEANQIENLDISVEEALRIILSAGVAVKSK